MEERKETEQLNQTTDVALHAAKTEADATAVDPTENEPLEKNVRLMSPTRMVLRRFFRSKLSIVGLVMIVSLFLFCYLGPVVYTRWGETERDEGGKIEYTQSVVTYTTEDGQTHTCYQVVETQKPFNSLAKPGADHLLGTGRLGICLQVMLLKKPQTPLSSGYLCKWCHSCW